MARACQSAAKKVGVLAWYLAFAQVYQAEWCWNGQNQAMLSCLRCGPRRLQWNRSGAGPFWTCRCALRFSVGANSGDSYPLFGREARQTSEGSERETSLLGEICGFHEAESQAREAATPAAPRGFRGAGGCTPTAGRDCPRRSQGHGKSRPQTSEHLWQEQFWARLGQKRQNLEATLQEAVPTPPHTETSELDLLSSLAKPFRPTAAHEVWVKDFVQEKRTEGVRPLAKLFWLQKPSSHF